MPWRKYISAPYLKWPFWIIILVLWVNIFFSANYNGELRWGVIVSQTGELAWALLLFTLLLGLARKLCPSCATLVRILPLRKHAGVLAFLIAGSHGFAEFIKNGIQKDWGAIFNYSFLDHFPLTLGSLSFLLMLPLFLTSTEWAVKKMGARLWFWLHKLAHPAFILAGLHFVLIGRGSLDWNPLFWLGVYGAGYLLLWSKRGLKKIRAGEPLFHLPDPLDSIHE